MAVNELPRYAVLYSQFQTDHLHLDDDQKKSLDRLFCFLYEHSDVYYLAFVRETILRDYLKYHASTSFESISFLQAIKDIKIFLCFIRNTKEINRELQIDFSIKNIYMWIEL
ncbi:hypothetical protein [Bacillus niameyensis]|uniref:hypothetical protein n=1 Tax=Bacillus niameyensis TaxID=1522308 RepID=UPI000782F5D5|nr:hypothetical protein [Bacillus niameyensis]